MIMDMGVEEVNYTLRSKWHNREPHSSLPAGMTPLRQSLFRPVYISGNVIPS